MKKFTLLFIFGCLLLPTLSLARPTTYPVTVETEAQRNDFEKSREIAWRGSARDPKALESIKNRPYEEMALLAEKFDNEEVSRFYEWNKNLRDFNADEKRILNELKGMPQDQAFNYIKSHYGFKYLTLSGYWELMNDPGGPARRTKIIDDFITKRFGKAYLANVEQLKALYQKDEYRRLKIEDEPVGGSELLYAIPLAERIAISLETGKSIPAVTNKGAGKVAK